MKQVVKVTLGAAGLCIAIGAWQGGLASLGLTQTQFEATVREAAREFSKEVSPNAFPAKARLAGKALSEERRAAVVREAGGMVKALVMSAAFQKAHAEYIRTSHQAVDHGVKVKTMEEMAAEANTPKGAAELEKQVQRQAALQTVQALRGVPPEALKPMFDSDVKSWTRQAQTGRGDRKALAEKLLARAKEIEALASSNPVEFQKAYSLLKSVELGGPATEAEITSGSNSAQIQQEQRNWNQYNLRGVLKAKLATFISTASTVDFAAQTAMQGKTLKFVNPAYESKSDLWKLLFRAGKAPASAALEITKAWLAELGG